MQKTMAILDSDESYAIRFMEYFKRQKDFTFEMIAFTKKEYLDDFKKSNKVDILILEEDLFDEETMKEDVESIYLLSEYREEMESLPPKIYKFQAAQNVMSKILSHDGGNGMERIDKKQEQESQIISIMALSKDSAKNAFAWSYALLLAEKQNVLFIPLEIFPVPILASALTSNACCSEFLYYLKQGDSNLSQKLQTLIRRVGNLNYLAGLTHGLDLLSINKEDMLTWLKILKQKKQFHTIVFYVTDFFEGAFTLIDQSERIVITQYQTSYESAVYKEWERQMQLLGMEYLNQKMQSISLSESDHINSAEMTLPQLQESVVWLKAARHLSVGKVRKHDTLCNE